MGAVDRRGGAGAEVRLNEEAAVSWFRRFSNLFRRDDLSSELDEELQFHLDARARDNIRSGMAADAARSDARKRFGNRTLAKEDTHEMDIVAPLETIGQDLRYALRSLRKSPGFTAVAILALALGMGATTAIFTIVNGVLLRPLPFSEHERLFLISYTMHGGGFEGGLGLYDGDYLQFQKQDQVFENVATFGENSLALTGSGEAVSVPVAMVTASFFPALHANPALGRAFFQKEERDGRVVVLSDQLWRTRLNADPNILGKTITLDGNAHQVIGVMPAGFAFPSDAEAWLPLAIGADGQNAYFRPVIGRLRASASREQAQSELEAFAQHLLAAAGQNRSRMIAEILPLKDLLVREIRKSLLIFMGAVGFVLLIACANVANLLLMRGTSRRPEIAVRTALGARRGRLIRQLLTESILLSLGGAAAGIVLAILGVPALLALAPVGRVPRIEEIHVDGWVLAFALGLGMLTGIVFGLMPAFQATGRGLLDFLGQSGRSFTRREGLRSALVVSEIGLALVLLTGAGLMLRSFLNIRAVNPGFRAENTLTMTVDLPESVYRTPASNRDFHTRTLARLADIPGVSAAGAVNWLPLNRALIRGDFELDGGRPIPKGLFVDKPAASPDYFRAMGIRLLQGRTFSERDTDDAPAVAIVSQSAARDLWPNEDPVGQRVSLENNPKPRDWLTVVGVVEDVRQQNVTDQPDLAIYQPYQQVTRPFFLSHVTYVVRTTASSASAASAMRGVLQEIDRSIPVQTISSMNDLISINTAEHLFQARLILIFSMLALLLSAIGIYGVLAYSITERTREIGIRMALGAEKSDITQMILKRSLLLATAGVALGVAGALAVTRVLAKLLFDVKPTDPATFLIVVSVLVTVALLAGLVPARRATKMDPLVALRCE